MSDTTEKPNYKKTLNLPKTAFPMKANLVQNEPASLKRWAGLADGQGLYAAMRDAASGRPRFVFHDGPPYANGSIHLGHLMNKCLKDFVVRSRFMLGQDCPFVPGWDCHGLPIEHKVMTDLVESGKSKKLDGLDEDTRRMAVRRECKAYADKQIDLQRGQMQRLLTIGDYADPYLTMAPDYEAAVLEVLAGLCDRGLVYKALKPVHWSIANETALADAELEYEDREDLSVYVDFEGADADAVYAAFGLSEDERDEQDLHATPSFMIWTTTPWTLPANLAIAVHEKFEYALAKVDGNLTVLAAELLPKVAKAARAEDVQVVATVTGDRLVGLRYKHPFRDAPPAIDDADTSKCYTVVSAEYVTLEDGTGLVHTAPGHGTEDYQTGLRVGLPVYCPVRGDGAYDGTVPEWIRGMNIWQANELIAKRLTESGHMFYQHKFMHSYPHDWRSKTPVIFRCTEQWFVAVDRPYKLGDEPVSGPGLSVRQRALVAIGASPFGVAPDTEHWTEDQGVSVEDKRVRSTKGPGEFSGEGGGPVGPLGRGGRDDLSAEPLSDTMARGAVAAGRGGDPVRFVPAWGRNRMRGMLDSRPDWCISRQRAWGLPIPGFTMPDGSAFMTAASVRAVASVVRARGSDAWFTLSPAELLGDYDPKADSEAPEALRSGEVAFAELKKGHDILDVWFESGSSWNAVVRQRFGDEAYPVDLYLEGSDQHRGWFQLSLLPALGVTGQSPFRTLLTHGFMVDKDGKKLSKSQGAALKDLFDRFGADVLRWWVCSIAYENDVKVDEAFFANAGQSYVKVRNTLRFMLSNLGDDTPGGTVGHAPTSLEAWVLGEFDAMSGKVAKAFERYAFHEAHRLLYSFCNTTLSAEYLSAVKDRLYCDAPDSDRRRRTQACLRTLTEGLCRLLAPVLCHTADEAWRALHAGDEDACVHLTGFPEPSGAAPDARWPAVMELIERASRTLEQARSTRGIDNPLDAGLRVADPDGLLAGFDPIDLADFCGVSRFETGSAEGIEVMDLREEPRCERSWKRDGTVRPRSDGGMLSDRDAAAVGVA
ncbi:MAG: class I tRNA ligase family protein [Phycisphaerales bacterium]|nr:isoleucine--tRNA ligase [Planctomycetota bacterium]MCH8508569.1 class I tRNA ligase family protein [Phycisphaerales bacterium]